MIHEGPQRFAPSYALVRTHFVVGVLGMCAFAFGLAWEARWMQGQFFQPTLLGLVHLCVLGWLVPIAIGALHELVPFVFEVKVRSERAAWIALCLHVVGVVLFVSHLWGLRAGVLLALGATTVATALVIYAANLIATIVRSRSTTLTGVHIAAALVYLMVGASLGAALAWNLCCPYLPGDHLDALRAHAHLAGLGFFGLLIMGVAYRLLEMFLLSHGAGERAGWISFCAVNAALLMLVGSFLLGGGPWLLRCAVAAAAVGVGAFLAQVLAITSRRMRRKVDVALGHTATSFVYLVASLWIGAAVALLPLVSPLRDRLILTYGLLVLPGFIGTIVVGQLYKIVPFLVWLQHFSPLVGLKKLPPASELLAERPKQVQYLLMHAGLVLLAAGVLSRQAAVRSVGAALFGASAALVAINLGRIDARRP